MITGDTPLRQVSISQAAAYFQGVGSLHNHPMIFCSGDGITVVTQYNTVTFPPGQIDRAFACFKAQLEELAYFE